MTPATPPGGQPGDLFIADFHPALGAYLAGRHAAGYDAVAGRTRFVLWLGTHADMNVGTRLGEDSGAEILAEANRRLVVSLAERYTGRGVPLGDLVQWGNAGLLRAAERYDPAKGYPFATYATWWIRQAITRGLARAPVTAPADGLTRAELRMRQALGREPTPEELAAELDPSV